MARRPENPRCPCCGAKLDMDSVTVQTGADAPMCWDCGLYATDPPEDCDNEQHRTAS